MDRTPQPSALPAEIAERRGDTLGMTRAEEAEYQRRLGEEIEELALDMLTRAGGQSLLTRTGGQSQQWPWQPCAMHWDEDADELLRMVALHAYTGSTIGLIDAARRLGEWLLDQTRDQARAVIERRTWGR